MDPQTPSPETIAGATGLFAGGVAFLRWIMLRISKDAITIKADASERDAFTALENRVVLLEKRLVEQEMMRGRLQAFIAKGIAYIAQCHCEDIAIISREELLYEYSRLVEGLNDPPHRIHTHDAG